MASGKLGAADLVAETDTTLYTVPASTVATAAVNICNRGPDPALVRMAVFSGASPAAADWVEYDAPIPVGGILERTGLVLGAGEQVAVRSDVAGVTARAHGFEQGA